MECTMPKATFTPIDNKKTLEYIVECLDEASRGLSFLRIDNFDTKKLKKKISEVNDVVYNNLRYFERSQQ